MATATAPRAKAEMRAESINDLPDSDFAYIEPGGTKDEGGKTVPRSLRHFPIHDAAHVRNALARAPQSEWGAKAMPKIRAAAKRLGIGEPAEEGKASTAAMHAQMGANVLASIYGLAASYTDDPEQLGCLTDAADCMTKWLELHRSVVGSAEDMGMAMQKAWSEELKAEPMSSAQLDKWLAGKVPRRVLVVPFGGPLPGGKAGLDLDGEYFDESTDLYGGYAALLRTRERLVDWHHDQDPTGVMKGAILGRVVLDEAPADDGVWADFWANAGERRRALVAALERKGIALYGSSQAAPGGVRKADDGHIEVWPLIRHTITTSPQNTHAVVPPLKALLAALPTDAVSTGAIAAAVLGMGDLGTVLGATSAAALRSRPGAGAEPARAEEVISEAGTLLGRVRQYLAQRTGG